MDADDVILPGRLMDQVQYLRGHPECDVVGGGVLVVSGEGSGLPGMAGKAGGGDLEVQSVTVHPANGTMLQWALLFSCPLLHPTVAFRTAAVRGVGGYDPQAFPAE